LHPYTLYRELFVKSDGSLIREGDLLKNSKLATTFERIANDPFTFYNGSMAVDIVQDIQDAGIGVYKNHTFNVA
jgi:gamma-glutamyltranspeptidase/glutathione hydrolase/leukotriene-C4 hydrolase